VHANVLKVKREFNELAWCNNTMASFLYLIARASPAKVKTGFLNPISARMEQCKPIGDWISVPSANFVVMATGVGPQHFTWFH